MRRVLAATALTAAALSAGVTGPGAVAHAAGGAPGGGDELGRTLSAVDRAGGALRGATSGVQQFIGRTAGSAGQSIGDAMVAGTRGGLPKASPPAPANG
ncbi:MULTISPECIES: hypothetical protein [Streptomyces]|uniref:ATP-binding protein n=1 Tax=Streptomyces luteosporeus TaxID=173856 RepID=A0ABP6GGL8_9ACTN